MGGSTARSGRALWLPASPILDEAGPGTPPAGGHHLNSAVAGSAGATLSRFPGQRAQDRRMLRRTTPMRLFWAPGMTPAPLEKPVAPRPGAPRVRPFVGARRLSDPASSRCARGQDPDADDGRDYRWLNLMSRVPRRPAPHRETAHPGCPAACWSGGRYVAGGGHCRRSVRRGVARTSRSGRTPRCGN